MQLKLTVRNVPESMLKEHATQKVKHAEIIQQCSLNHIPYFIFF